MHPVGGFTIPASHPSLAGHFPGRPVVPGVVLLAELLAALRQAHPSLAHPSLAPTGLAPTGLAPTGLPTVRFLAPVLPGQPVQLHAGPHPAGLAFTAEVNGRTVLRGTLRT